MIRISKTGYTGATRIEEMNWGYMIIENEIFTKYAIINVE